MLKHTTVTIKITRPRNFLSYSYEFCGITNIDYKTLRFLALSRDVNPDMMVMTPCLIKVTHTAQFAQMANNPL